MPKCKIFKPYLTQKMGKIGSIGVETPGVGPSEPNSYAKNVANWLGLG